MDNAPALEETTTETAPPEAPKAEFNEPAVNGVEATPLSEAVPAEDEVTAAPEKDELERLLEDPTGPFSLSSGTTFQIRQLRLRELLRLLRIITRGASVTMPAMNLDFDNPDEFVQTFIAMVIFSIPEAEDETVDFVQSMVEPVPSGFEDADARARVALLRELENPDLEDTITILTVIVATEGRDLAALGKRLRSMLGAARKMGQVPPAVAAQMGG